MTSILRQAGVSTLSVRNAQAIESRIRSQVHKKQIRIKTFFQDYDKLRKGHCIEDKFISGLSTALNFLSISLTGEEIQLLADKYRVTPGDLMRYIDFVTSIDGHVSQEQQISEDDQVLKQLLKYIKWSISSKRIFLKNPLQDYDRTKSTFITKDQFIRVLDNLNLVRNQQLTQLLCEKYARRDHPKQIRYVDFIKDVENVNEVETYVVKGIIPNQKVVNPLANVVSDLHKDSVTQEFYVQKKLPQQNLTIAELLKRIQAQVTLKRIRIKEFFLDFDGLRKNIVTGDQFRRVLMTMNITISENQYKEIYKNYKVDDSRDERIKWMDFCQDVDLVFTQKGLQKNPLHKVTQIDKTVFEPVKHIAITLTPQQQQKLDQLLNTYRSVINNKRTHLKPLFEDFDITKIGYVTKNQFTRILKQFDFIPKDEKLLDLLLKSYMDRGNLSEVNYYQFIRDVDKYQEEGKILNALHTDTFKDYEYKPRVSKATIRAQVPSDLQDLFGRIRKIVKERRIRLAEFLRDFDKLRHGSVTKDQFRLGLNMAMIALSQKEFDLILNHYTSQEQPTHIKWKTFCDAIDQVFNLKELQKVPPNEKVNLAATTFKYGKIQISAQEAQIANKIKENFKNYQLINRLDTKQLFENWDQLNRFKVSPKQFRQVLATVGFNLTEEQNKAICKLYASEDEQQKEVKYLQFLNDTKPYDFSYMTATKQQFKKGTGQRKAIPNQVSQIMNELRKTTKLNRLRYREYFKDFDPLNKGTIKKNKFKSIVHQTMKVALEDPQLEMLQKYYLDENDNTMVNYSQFCTDLQIVFNLPDYEKEPTVRPPVFDYTVLHEKKKEEDINALMTRLGEVIRKHRIMLKNFFQDNDKPKIGRISFTRMRSILDNNKIPLNDAQFNLLCKHFAFENKEFSYVNFIEALKKYEEEDL